MYEDGDVDVVVRHSADGEPIGLQLPSPSRLFAWEAAIGEAVQALQCQCNDDGEPIADMPMHLQLLRAVRRVLGRSVRTLNLQLS